MVLWHQARIDAVHRANGDNPDHDQPGDPSATVTQSGLKVDGGQATFTLTLTERGEGSFSSPGHLVRQGGDWRVCQTIAGH